MTSSFTLTELKKGFLADLTGAMKRYEIEEEFGLISSSFSCYQKEIMESLSIFNWETVKRHYKGEKKRHLLLKALKKSGRKSCLSAQRYCFLLKIFCWWQAKKQEYLPPNHKHVKYSKVKSKVLLLNWM